MKLHFHGQDYENPYIQWQVVEGKIRGQYRGCSLENLFFKRTTPHSTSSSRINLS